VLDRLYLTTAPILVGDGVPGVRFAGSDLIADALTASSVQRYNLGRDLCTVFDFSTTRPDLQPLRQGQDVEMTKIDTQDPISELGAP
jgi:hypothetical protein